MALRYGWTTGACSTAAAVAAWQVWLTGKAPAKVTLPLGRGSITNGTFAIEEWGIDKNRQAFASVIKDAGDDPDVTHGATIYVHVKSELQGTGIVFCGGDGVGVVTKRGLSLAVGEPAINPAPREMIKKHLQQISQKYNADADIRVTISIKDGARLATQTMNEKLGIKGGLSVLGTTGIVIPFSCSAWVASIHQAVDVAMAEGVTCLGAAVGKKSEQAVREVTNLPWEAIIEMGDFMGALVAHVRRQKTIKSLTIAGGFAKMAKWANGAKDLHHKRSHVSHEALASWLSDEGAEDGLCREVRNSSSAGEALLLATEAGIDLAAIVAKRAQQRLRPMLPLTMSCRILIIDKEGCVVADE